MGAQSLPSRLPALVRGLDPSILSSVSLSVSAARLMQCKTLLSMQAHSAGGNTRSQQVPSFCLAVSLHRSHCSRMRPEGGRSKVPRVHFAYTVLVSHRSTPWISRACSPTRCSADLFLVTIQSLFPSFYNSSSLDWLPLSPFLSTHLPR